MANKVFVVTGCPSLSDLSVVFFNRDSKQSLTFIVNDDALIMSMNVRVIRYVEQSLTGWEVGGELVEGPPRFVGFESKCHFDTETGRGQLEVTYMDLPKEYEQYEIMNTVVVKEFGRIVSLKYGRREVKLGQKVISNGNYSRAVPKGTMGIVVNLVDPLTYNRRVEEVMDVWFEGKTSYSLAVKFRDLES